VNIGPEDFFQSALKERQLDEHIHGFKGFGGHRLPANIVGSAARREKESPFLNPMSDPGLFVFPLLKINVARRDPREERFTDGGKVQRSDGRRQRDEPGFDVSPGFAAAGEQAFPVHIALEGFGGCCFRNQHVEVYESTCFHAKLKPCFVIGIVLMRSPVAVKTAFAIAGRIGGNAGSPNPVGELLDLIQCTSMGGVCDIFTNGCW